MALRNGQIGKLDDDCGIAGAIIRAVYIAAAGYGYLIDLRRSGSTVINVSASMVMRSPSPSMWPGSHYAASQSSNRIRRGDVNGANNSASDSTIIVQLPDLTIAKSHTGNFFQGQVGAVYNVTVTNSGPGPTTASVSVADTLPGRADANGGGGHRLDLPISWRRQ